MPNTSDSDANDQLPPLQPPEGRVEQRLRTAKDSLPGRRDALKPGALGGLPTDPQSDESRNPPANAPTIDDTGTTNRRGTRRSM